MTCGLLKLPGNCISRSSRLGLQTNNGRQDLLLLVRKPHSGGAFSAFRGSSRMPQNLISALNPTRLSTYEAEWARLASISPTQVSRPAVAALYVWQVSLSSAWYETLAFTEAIVRDAVDRSLRDWNDKQGYSTNWLATPANPLSGLVQRAATEANRRASTAAQKRAPNHPRHGAPITFDDTVAQLDFGNIVYLFPQAPPTNRSQLGSGYTNRENLWRHGLVNAFPRLNSSLTKSWSGHIPQNLPPLVQNAYGVGIALEKLRRLRNRIGHHEQTFRVQHSDRLKDVSILLRGINHGSAEGLKKLDRVRRTLAMMPQP